MFEFSQKAPAKVGVDSAAALSSPKAPKDIDDQVVLSLLLSGRVDPSDVHKVVNSRKAGDRRPLWRALAEETTIERELIFGEAANIFAFETLDIPIAVAALFLQQNRSRFTDDQWHEMKQLDVVPVALQSSAEADDLRWIFASADPFRSEVTRLLESMGVAAYQLTYIAKDELDQIIALDVPSRNEFLDQIRNETRVTDLATAPDADASIDEREVESQIKQSALLSLFEGLLIEGVRKGASDIHIRPNERGKIDINFRIDGRLHCWFTEEHTHPEAFLAVVKDHIAGVDRFERDCAQDGALQRVIDGTRIRFRASVIPVGGHDIRDRLESIVLRILDDRNAPVALDELGLDELSLQYLNDSIAQPYGLVIVTGPTGSGKSTTLNAALRTVASPELNVLSIEDPIEYVMPKVAQIKLSHKLGIEDALRSILRHDPDVVMVGEMRDQVTAELAIQLANTGHLAFTTLHTNDAAAAITRLYKMGIEPFLIAYAINLVTAQRLVAKLCPQCKQADENVDSELLARLGLSKSEIEAGTFYTAASGSCEGCGGSGYKGRLPVVEVLPFTTKIRRHIVTAGQGVDESYIRECAREAGLPTLAMASIRLAAAGHTSIAEARRVVFLQT